MRVASLLPTFILAKRDFSPIPDNIKILIKNEFLSARELESIKDAYEIKFKIVVDYKKEEKELGKVEIIYSCLVLKEIDEKIQPNDIKDKVYPSTIRILWNKIAKDIMDISQKVGLPNPIPIKFVFEK